MIKDIFIDRDISINENLKNLYIQLEFEVEIINDFKKILLEVTYSILDKNVRRLFKRFTSRIS